MKNRYRYWIVVLMLATGGVAFADTTKADKPTEAKPAPPKQDPAGASAEVKAGTAVEKHEIVGEASTFAPGATVWVWSRITNGQGTVKHVWRLADGEMVESVLIPTEKRLTLCISSQAGCAMGCTFCATGTMGIVRNLSAGEIVGEVLALMLKREDLAPERIVLVTFTEKAAGEIGRASCRERV